MEGMTVSEAFTNLEIDRSAVKGYVETWEEFDFAGCFGQEGIPPDQRSDELARHALQPLMEDVVRVGRRVDELSMRAVSRLHRAAQLIEQSLKVVAGQKPNDSVEARHRERHRVETAVIGSVDKALPLLFRAESEFLEMQLKEQRHVVEESKVLLRNLLEEKAAVRDLRRSVEEMQKAVQDAAELQGLTRQGQEFHKAATEYRRAAWAWALGAAALAGVLISCVISITEVGAPPPMPAESWLVAANLSHYAARALGVSLLSFLMVVCVRNFRAAKHNQVMNGHRWGALMTFQEFKAAAKGGAVEDAVLLHATEAVFSTQASGYDDGHVGGTHVSEVLAALKDTRK